MEIYLVGGAVRDQLLGLSVKERDWVVVGASVQEMLDLGYRQVGKDFPVFLNPDTNEEYALARTERKIGPGYTGFTFNASEKVTLEEDLKRRDLTINAIAQTLEGTLIDPYGGRKDLEHKLLRHVSEAFIEDPVRILRVARFQARYAELGFRVAPETIKLMSKMVELGEINALVPERVWKEFEKALSESHPEQFFSVLADCNGLNILFPEIALNSKGMTALLHATKKTEDLTIRFAALLFDCSESQVQKICDLYRIPNQYRDIIKLVKKNLKTYSALNQLTAKEIVTFLSKTDAFRREKRFFQFLETCSLCENANLFTIWVKYLNAAKNVKIKNIDENLKGKEIAEKILSEREAQVANVMKKIP